MPGRYNFKINFYILFYTNRNSFASLLAFAAALEVEEEEEEEAPLSSFVKSSRDGKSLASATLGGGISLSSAIKLRDERMASIFFNKKDFVKSIKI